MESNSNQQDQKMRKTDRLDKFVAYKGFNDNKITRVCQNSSRNARQIQEKRAKTLRAHLRVRASAFPELQPGMADLWRRGYAGRNKS